MQKILRAGRIFTGEEWLHDHEILIENGRVATVRPSGAGEKEALDLGNSLIVPSFVDVQVYGAGGRLLSAFPLPDTLRLMHSVFSRQGTALFLPTLATNDTAVFKNAIDAVRAYWDSGGKGVYGLHLEGPWICMEKRGAHIAEWVRKPELEDVKELLHYGEDVIKMITLAPEVCSDEVIDFLLSKNIVLSAGHSNASFRHSIKAFDQGISAATHLFNAMSPLHHREPGLAGAVMDHGAVMASIIPDGIHVDYAALRIAKKIMGERLFAITDAVTETSEGPYRHRLATDRYECEGVLSGSALSMHNAFTNLVRHGGIEMGEALRMCSVYPAKLLGCTEDYGRIGEGSLAQFLVLDQELNIREVVTL
ncbi:MAG TPA: N-acetylglucosamine-6-phosphate deacetylase [Flavisolibacter sp.]|nr:N-acetylglucosamine-6-phosphate deacetylase [Flavisolibacter sp.]